MSVDEEIGPRTRVVRRIPWSAWKTLDHTLDTLARWPECRSTEAAVRDVASRWPGPTRLALAAMLATCDAIEEALP